MFKLFIVDDEIDLIEGIKTLIKWSDYDIEICGQANNGLTAFQLIKILRPDILIADIRMPKMDGLKLLINLKEENINVKSIILSGYCDFDTAKTAINLNIIEYLLKPCRPKEIIEVVLKAKKLLEDEQKNIRILEDYKTSYNESILQKKREFLMELAIDENINFIEIESKAYSYHIKTSLEKSFLAITFSIDNKNKILDKKNVVEMNWNIVNYTNTVLHKEIVGDFQINNETTFILYIDKSYYNSRRFLETITKIKNEIKALSENTLTIGVGSIVTDLIAINESYKDARIALEAKFFLGNDRVISLGNIHAYEDMTGFYPVNEEIDILNCLETGNKVLMQQKLEDFYNKLCDEKLPSKGFLQKISISFCSRVYKFCVDKNINASQIFDFNLKTFDKIEECETMIELTEYVSSLLDSILQCMGDVHKKNIFTRKAVEYIMKNYPNDISLEVISRELYITPGYLSLLFKQEMGINFIDFITKYRIERAMELLKNSSLKNYQVSNMIGFKDEKYFSQIFKKYVGLTPSQYKQK
ncbi:MAG: response regulator [Clostridiaceae bacterium]|nr:response regulator [Clostridiaceae bacterium]